MSVLALNRCLILVFAVTPESGLLALRSVDGQLQPDGVPGGAGRLQGGITLVSALTSRAVEVDAGLAVVGLSNLMNLAVR